LTGREERNLLESPRFGDLARDNQVPVVNRVERASEQDNLLAHGQDLASKGLPPLQARAPRV
jgi:hypothetical protein